MAWEQHTTLTTTEAASTLRVDVAEFESIVASRKLQPAEETQYGVLWNRRDVLRIRQLIYERAKRKAK